MASSDPKALSSTGKTRLFTEKKLQRVGDACARKRYLEERERKEKLGRLPGESGTCISLEGWVSVDAGMGGEGNGKSVSKIQREPWLACGTFG